MRLVLDTNVFVFGFLDLAQGTTSSETRILERLLKKDTTLLLSEIIGAQLVSVILRVKDKDFAGLIRHMIWTDFDAEFVDIRAQHRDSPSSIPRKDIDIYLTALHGKADALITNDRAFLSSAKTQGRFACLTPLEFEERFL